jgi:hypothetical protein
MKKTIILEKGWTKKLEKFEERINNQSGYEALSMLHNGTGYGALMKRSV